MYDVLDLYQEPYDPSRPVICLDEKPKQLLSDRKKPLPMRPGVPERYDYEYVRGGTANIFVAVEFKAGMRITQVTPRRAMTDFALFLKMVVDQYLDAEVIRVVMDNLSTHREKALIEAFGQGEADRIMARVEFHFTPRHGSWLNAAEIEIGVMGTEWTDRRIGDLGDLAREVSAWTRRRNLARDKIDWRFTREKADRKLSKHYV
jgi:transposase